MIYIKSAEEFLRIIYKFNEVLVFPEGNEGELALEFLKYTKTLNRICCVAKERVDSFRNIAQKFAHSRPVIPLEYLPHFRQSGIIIIAAPPRAHDIIDEKLTSLGFWNLIYLNAEALKQMELYLNQLLGSGGALIWFLNNITDKITRLEKLVTEQNEICAVNTKTFSEYRNCFRGRKIFIFASGPSLKYYVNTPPKNQLTLV